MNVEQAPTQIVSPMFHTFIDKDGLALPVEVLDRMGWGVDTDVELSISKETGELIIRKTI